jgi:hypothetical protein
VNGVIFTLQVIAIAMALDGAWLLIRWLRDRRVQRPPPPDVFLPPGWQRWYPDGRGNIRLYEWHNGWSEVRHRRFEVPKDEPAES